MGKRYQTEKLVLIALLVALCVVLGVVDRAISAGISPHPAIRLGLSNIIVLTALYYLDFFDSLLLVILKILLTGLILGSFTVFLISTFGTALSFIVMYFLLKISKNNFSVIGVSLAGALAHTIGQVFGLALIDFYSDTVVFSLLWLIPLSAVTGVFVGIIVTSLRTYLDKGLVFKTVFKQEQDNELLTSLINEEE